MNSGALVDYITHGQRRVAVSVSGSGSPTVVLVSGLVSHVDALWEDPRFVDFAARIGAASRLVTFDPAGTGASSPPLGPSGDDVGELGAVVDWCDDDVILLGWLSGCGAAGRLAHRSVRKRVLCAPYRLAPNVPLDDWGSGGTMAAIAPSRSPFERDLWARLERATASPSALSHVERRLRDGAAPTDADAVLACPSRSPLELDLCGAPEAVHIDTADAIPWGDAAVDVTRLLAPPIAAAGERRRALVAVLVTDIIGSTTKASAVSSADWKYRLETFDAVVSDRVEAAGGRVGRRTGDGAVATFPLALDAVRAAWEVACQATRIGLPARTGVHVGEVDLIGSTPEGLTVRIADRVAAAGAEGEVMLSPATVAVLAGVALSLEPGAIVDLPRLGHVQVATLIEEPPRR